MDFRVLLALLLLPAASAQVLTDPAGDSGAHPCSPATDILAFDAIAHADGYTFEYTFSAPFADVADHAAAQDAAGSCFWSYTDFTFQGIDGFEDAVYFDHNALPAYETGWRAYLHDAGNDLELTLDGAVIRIEVPFDVLGAPGEEPRIGNFLVQVSTALDKHALTYETDWAPDNGQACDCWTGPFVVSKSHSVPVMAEPAQPAPGSDPAPEEDVPLGGWIGWVALGAVALLRRQSL